MDRPLHKHNATVRQWYPTGRLQIRSKTCLHEAFHFICSAQHGSHIIWNSSQCFDLIRPADLWFTAAMSTLIGSTCSFSQNSPHFVYLRFQNVNFKVASSHFDFHPPAHLELYSSTPTHFRFHPLMCVCRSIPKWFRGAENARARTLPQSPQSSPGYSWIWCFPAFFDLYRLEAVEGGEAPFEERFGEGGQIFAGHTNKRVDHGWGPQVAAKLHVFDL